jgi:hypothetical protein
MAGIEKDPGEKVIRFTAGSLENYTLTVNPELIKIECYTPGSPTGGNGTECSHSIAADISDFFDDDSSQGSVENLMYKTPHFGVDEWRDLHQLIADFSTENWVWNETNWDD